MIPVGKLVNISPEEAEKLWTVGIETVNDLWVKIGLNLHKGVDQLAQETGISVPRLVDLLTAQALWEIEKRETPWYRRAAPGLVVITFFVFCISSVLMMLRIPSLVTPLSGFLVLLFVLGINPVN